MADLARRSVQRAGCSTAKLVQLASQHGRWVQARCFEHPQHAAYRDQRLAAEAMQAESYCNDCDGTGWRPIPRDDFVALLAYCGDESARTATDWPLGAPVTKWARGQIDTYLPGYLEGLARWCRDLPAIAAIYAAEFALPVWEDQQGYEYRPDGMGGKPDLVNKYTGTNFAGYQSRIWAARWAVTAAVAWRDGGRTKALEDTWVQRNGWDTLIPEFAPGPTDTRDTKRAARRAAAAEHLATGAEQHARTGLLTWVRASIEVWS